MAKTPWGYSSQKAFAAPSECHPEAASVLFHLGWQAPAIPQIPLFDLKEGVKVDESCVGSIAG